MMQQYKSNGGKKMCKTKKKNLKPEVKPITYIYMFVNNSIIITVQWK